MDIEQAVWQHLTGDAEIKRLIGNRLYPDQVPQGEQLPYVVYSQAQRLRSRTFTGYVSLNACSIHMEIYGATRSSVVDVRQAIGSRLDGFTGTIGSQTVAVSGVFHDGEDTGAEVPVHGNELGEYMASLDLTIHYNNI